MTRADRGQQGRFLRVMACGFLFSSLALWSGCDESAVQNGRDAPRVMLLPRKFQGPGKVAQSLATGGRALVFLELTSSADGSPLEVDPAWSFQMVVRSPQGDLVPLSTDPVVPRTWASDPGIRLIGGFNAPMSGVFQIDITSENCPHRAAPMIVLPIT